MHLATVIAALWNCMQISEADIYGPPAKGGRSGVAAAAAAAGGEVSGSATVTLGTLRIPLLPAQCANLHEGQSQALLHSRSWWGARGEEQAARAAGLRLLQRLLASGDLPMASLCVVGIAPRVTDPLRRFDNDCYLHFALAVTEEQPCYPAVKAAAQAAGLFIKDLKVPVDTHFSR
jgi:hypothetical protein